VLIPHHFLLFASLILSVQYHPTAQTPIPASTSLILLGALLLVLIILGGVLWVTRRK
jgi:hypothetical protein